MKRTKAILRVLPLVFPVLQSLTEAMIEYCRVLLSKDERQLY
jgi:hypothetical protein